MKKKVVLVVLLGLIFSWSVGEADTVNGDLKVHILDVGQADAIFVECPDKQHCMLIDGGGRRYPGSATKFQNYLHTAYEQGGYDQLDLVIATHPHSDHIGSMEWVLGNFEINTYIDNGRSHPSSLFADLFKALFMPLTKPSRYKSTLNQKTPPKIDFCLADNVYAEILKPACFGSLSHPNDNSVVVRLQYNNQTFLFVGDAEEKEEKQLLDDPKTKEKLDVDFLKVGHHGSNTSSSQEFLDIVTPEVMAISCGQKETGSNNSYKHPRKKTVNRLLQCIINEPQENLRQADVYNSQDKKWEAITIKKGLYLTSVDGDIMIACDGQILRKE